MLKKGLFLVFFIIAVLFVSCLPHITKSLDRDLGEDNIIDQRYRDISVITDKEIKKAKETLHIAYQHTSHGSQITQGMTALALFPAYNDRFAWSETAKQNSLHLDDYGIPGCRDLSVGDWEDENNDTPWVVATRELLDNPANNHFNVVMWSWCSINGHNAERYVRNMEKLIQEYPDVVFVFMTGHAEGQSLDMTPNSVHYNNKYIREHCRLYGRVLYDFAAIEAYDPDGQYYWNLDMQDNLNYSRGNWAVEWIAENPHSDLTLLTMGSEDQGVRPCTDCAHSSSPVQANLNCVLKAQAAWNLWVYLAETYF